MNIKPDKKLNIQLEADIADYLNGHMSATLLVDFEKRLQTDLELQARVNTELQLMQLLRGTLSSSIQAGVVNEAGTLNEEIAKEGAGHELDDSSTQVHSPVAAPYSFEGLRAQIEDSNSRQSTGARKSSTEKWRLAEVFSHLGNRWRQPAWVAPAAFAAFALVAVPIFYNSTDQTDSVRGVGYGSSNGAAGDQSEGALFRTLTQDTIDFKQSILRVVARSDTQVKALTLDYGLEVLAEYEGAATVDVVAGGSHEELMKKLQLDPRVSLVRFIETSARGEEQ